MGWEGSCWKVPRRRRRQGWPTFPMLDPFPCIHGPGATSTKGEEQSFPGSTTAKGALDSVQSWAEEGTVREGKWSWEETLVLWVSAAGKTTSLFPVVSVSLPRSQRSSWH